MSGPGAAPILLVGAGGHGRSCIDVIERGGGFRIAGLVDRDPALRGRDVLGYPVIGTEDDLPALRRRCGRALVAVGHIGSAAARAALYERLRELGFELPAVVSPLACVSRHAAIGDGTIVMHHAVVNAAARIGANCIINTKALIEHDARVGDHCHVSTAAVVNGEARLGDRCFVGSNATVVNGVRLADDQFVRAGSLVKPERVGQARA